MPPPPRSLPGPARTCRPSGISLSQSCSRPSAAPPNAGQSLLSLTVSRGICQKRVLPSDLPSAVGKVNTCAGLRWFQGRNYVWNEARAPHPLQAPPAPQPLCLEHQSMWPRLGVNLVWGRLS